MSLNLSAVAFYDHFLAQKVYYINQQLTKRKKTWSVNDAKAAGESLDNP